ncbi:cyclic AMP response element-binding protein B isoform X3 [Lutzomyia longipalpis]|uniref:cyclic AMP response element-binding protein B isoform X3 n=1 Tax=Lutzomyia longipalpis TaxID=7200 RepID=UPI002483DC0B|nr:cyclic AMP response element-binding protein B isoform X3 [Lutzomyia longipalpis]XP_055680514.1 cyclic AMP response element-binding protein B isoform X3 [Lutzomyia longipalpis]
MDSMVEENGNSSIDPLSDQTSPSETNSGSAVLTTAANIVQFIPTQAVQVSQSVIQANQSSVIQTATNLQPMTLAKGVLYVNKNNSVIHTAPAGLQVKIKPEPNTTPTQVQVNDTNSEDDSITDDESPKRRRDLLTRRPSYHRILKEISGPDIAVLGGPVLAEDQSRKREIRLQKNREAARECRRKKKEYIKCLENRVAVLENQNKALIEELKTLKELYCQSKND